MVIPEDLKLGSDFHSSGEGGINPRRLGVSFTVSPGSSEYNDWGKSRVIIAAINIITKYYFKLYYAQVVELADTQG